MNLFTRTKLFISIAIVLTAFAAGRYSVSPPSVKTTSSTKTTDKQTENKNIHTKKTVTETKKPDGTDTIVTQIDQIVGDNKTDQSQTDKEFQQTVTPPKKNTLNISVLGANDFSRGLLVPTYGLAVHKEVLGPVTVGAFGLMNGVVGVSVGLDF